MIARTSLVRTAATRVVARRQISSEPTLHKAKDKWADLLKTRPPKDHMDEHVSEIIVEYKNTTNFRIPKPFFLTIFPFRCDRSTTSWCFTRPTMVPSLLLAS